MNDQLKSKAAQQTKGSVKEAIGKLTGDTRAQREGAAEKAEAEARTVASRTSADPGAGSISTKK
jgi:uncharacterized protein YjbJ (UPF0337 family)